MDQIKAQNALQILYKNWKNSLRLSEQELCNLGAPLFLNITKKYAKSAKRVLVLGQETAGWEWTRNLRVNHPRYPLDYPYQDILSMGDLVDNHDAVEALLWGYREFAFAKYQPEVYNSPFWQAFRKIQDWPDVGVMWGNLVRADYSPPEENTYGYSINNASEQTRKVLIDQQMHLLTFEIAILEPQVCVFFTGPDYDSIISSTFSGCEFLPCDGVPTRELARLAHKSLPVTSFRTFHPKYLRLSRKWSYIENIQAMAYADQP